MAEDVILGGVTREDVLLNFAASREDVLLPIVTREDVILNTTVLREDVLLPLIQVPGGVVLGEGETIFADGDFVIKPD
jgi:hypothetical protein